ncbi:MAG TPA: S-layer homology domain-containing protein, partial [Acidobacteria bacterium]|nr:S-layer homology domain-containing protein [Acidobacteriota bacterium]
ADYCPFAPVTRAQMAVFLLRTLEGGDYQPPPCATPPFDDVPCDSWFGPWVAELKARAITTGCHGTEYCPFDPVTRAQMAAFLDRAFTLGS